MKKSKKPASGSKGESAPETATRPLTVLYRHKTVSIPPEAYELLEAVQKIVAQRGAGEIRGMLSPEHQAALDGLLSRKSKFTMGHTFWIACAMALDQLGE
jgi:hypothetical protein